MTIINIISAVSIGSLQFLTSYQSLGFPHEYVVTLISFGGDLVTPCIKSSIYSYMPFLFKVDHKFCVFCLKSNIYSDVHFFMFKLTICYVTSLSKATSTHMFIFFTFKLTICYVTSQSKAASNHMCIKYKQSSYQHIYKTFRYRQKSYQYNRFL